MAAGVRTYQNAHTQDDRTDIVLDASEAETVPEAGTELSGDEEEFLYESESTDGMDDSEITVEKLGIAINEASQFAWNWFWDAKQIDETDTIKGTYLVDGFKIEGFDFYAVTAEGIQDKASLRELTHHYFTHDITDKMMSQQCWIEQDGKLYVSATFGVGGFNPDALYISLNRISDTCYEIEIYESYNYGMQEEPIIVHYLLENGDWVFDSVLCYLGETIPVYPRDAAPNLPSYEDELTGSYFAEYEDVKITITATNTSDYLLTYITSEVTLENIPLAYFNGNTDTQKMLMFNVDAYYPEYSGYIEVIWSKNDLFQYSYNAMIEGLTDTGGGYSPLKKAGVFVSAN